jgi:hypothetical protein
VTQAVNVGRALRTLAAAQAFLQAYADSLIAEDHVIEAEREALAAGVTAEQLKAGRDLINQAAWS